ncbi:MAG: hypothetical protein AMXMBFR64_41960 [Myxococcales bacterium]
MGEPTPAMLRTLAAEIRAELPSIDRTLDDVALADPTGDDVLDRLRLYAGAAILDTFYTGVDRLLERVARTFDAVPTGPHWHTELLGAASLDVPGVRPRILTRESLAGLKRYLAFRHRFRNLYLFDLDPRQMAPLLADLAPVWTTVREDLAGFSGALDALAAAV